MALVSGISLDPEAAIGVTKRLPPKWVDGADEVSCMANPALSFSHVGVCLCCQLYCQCCNFYDRSGFRRKIKASTFSNS